MPDQDQARAFPHRCRSCACQVERVLRVVPAAGIHREGNPTIGTDAGKRGAPRERVLSDVELAAIWKATVEIGGHYGAIIQLLLLTGSRRAEIGGMAWSELNLDAPNPTWTLPRERSKNHRAL